LRKIALVVLIIVLLPNLSAGADKVGSEGCKRVHKGSYLDRYRSDLDGDGIKELIMLEEIPGEDQDELVKEVKLVVRTRRGDYRYNIGPVYYICGVEEMRISDRIKPFISLWYFAGAHAIWMELFSFNGTELIGEIKIFSDAGSIEVKDMDNDGVRDIAAIDRDYDNNPTENGYTKLYKFTNNKWQFVSVRRIFQKNSYEENYDQI